MVQTSGRAQASGQAQSRAQTKRTKILRAAADVFRQKGFARAGMREIAAALGMTQGALYYYFRSKEDLLFQCQMLGLRGLLEGARRTVRSPATAPAKLRGLVRDHLRHILEELGGGFAHVEFGNLPPDQLAEVVAERDRYEELVRRVLREGAAAGELRCRDERIAALALLGALNWTVVWWRPGGRLDLDALADGITDTFLEGLTA